MNICGAPCSRTGNGICKNKVRRKGQLCYAHKDLKHFTQLDIAEVVQLLIVEGRRGLDSLDTIEDPSARALATREACRCFSTMAALCKQFQVKFE